MRLNITFFFILLGVSFPIYSWNALGHQLIVQIALDAVDKKVQKQYQKYNKALDQSYAAQSLVKAAPWLDSLRKNEKTAYLSRYHYLNTPFLVGKVKSIEIDKINVLTALKQAMAVLQNPYANMQEKGLQLRILLHVVGDLHQPLHVINRITLQHPKGDKGGTLFNLKNSAFAQTLHQYWDKGGGILIAHKRRGEIKKYAERLKKKYPCVPRGLMPNLWAKESYNLAKTIAYRLPENSKPTKSYQKKVQQITEKRIALAGCRLAQILQSLIIT